MEKYNNCVIGSRSVFPPRGLQETNIGIVHISDINHYYTLNLSRKIENHLSKLTGAGTGDSVEDSMFLATMEAYERLANSIPVSQQVIASQEELGDLAVPLSDFPKMNQSETSSNGIEKKYLRWSESYNLTDQSRCYIPQVYINLYTHFNYNGEGLTHPISTGCAIHQDYTRAVINGIYEVIERDGIALFWLLKRPLKKLDKQEFIDDLEIFSSPFLGKTTLYDASTINGVYTFCLRAETHFSESIRNVVMFSSNTCPKEAISKLKKELISVIYSLANGIEKQSNLLKQDPMSFYHVDEGALYMAHPSKAYAFEFLNNSSKGSIPTNEIQFSSYGEELRYLSRN